MHAAYHGYPGDKAHEARFRKQVQRGTHRHGEAAKLRRQAAAMEEDLNWLVGEVEECAARYGEHDSHVTSGRATICKLLAQQKALYARALELERPGA